MNIKTDTYKLNNLNKINILLGKNGAGKSTLLKLINTAKDDNGKDIYSEYITPERGGILKDDASISTSIKGNSKWTSQTRNTNQYTKFKEQTIYRYQSLQLNVLQAMEEKLSKATANGTAIPTEVSSYTFFKKYIDSINTLLENIEIKRKKGDSFEIFKKGTTTLIEPSSISSGESELISLAIECLYFQKSDSEDKEKILFLDEPDVHLHPDLQVKFMRFIHSLVVETGSEFKVILATHSTAFLGALEKIEDVCIAFMTPNQTTIDFKPVTDIYKEFLPVFGAHPLSNVFNEAPVLLVEGEDDERIWQQAVRTSVGTIKVYPCVCGDVNRIRLFENEIKIVINSIYDNAKAYSIRDRDDTSEDDLVDDPPIIKYKLKCYSAENLLLTDEVLASMNETWDSLKEKMNEWIVEKNGKIHSQLDDMIAFQAGEYDRKTLKVKSLRVLIPAIMGSDKPWEVIVGKVIAGLKWDTTTDYAKDGSIYNFLGKKLVEGLLPKR